MSYDVCKGKWIQGGKDHKCCLPKDHAHKCECDCGDRMRVVNPAPKFTLKKFVKRRSKASPQEAEG